MGRRTNQIGFLQLTVVRKGEVHGFDHGLFKFCTRKTFTAADHRVEGQVQSGATSVQVQLEDALAFIRAGEVEQEDFVEAPFAQQFWRQSVDAVGRRNHEDRRLLLCHPSEHAGQHALAGAPIAAAVPSESLVDLINPEHARSHRLRSLNGFAGPGFTGTHQTREQASHIQPEQGHGPAAGNGFGGQRFAGALGAHQQNAAGHGQAELTCFLGEGPMALLQPVLQAIKSPD